MGKEVIFIDLADPGYTAATLKNRAEKMRKTLEEAGFEPDDPEGFVKDLTEVFATAEREKPKRCYIGSRNVYKNINKYCDQFGITLFQNTSLSSAELMNRLEDAEKIFIVSTTGASLINTLASRFIPEALIRGTDIYVLIPNKNSDYVNDVAEIESPDDIEGHIGRFAREFDGVIYNLKECLRRAGNLSEDFKGRIFLGCTHDLLRQTITLSVNGDHIWGWLSLTMPPKRTVDGTPSFEFSGRKGERCIANLVYEHVDSIKDTAVRRGHFVNLAEVNDFSEFFLEGRTAEKFWRDAYDRAKLNTLERDGECDLIEVAAQHPLRKDGTPGREFRARLDRAVRLYRQLEEEGQEVMIYVPGSLHRHEGKVDPCSLSDSGKGYLIRKGIPESNILGEDANRQYKGDLGVYNTADECYVAARIFEDGDYRRLHCVCSSNQIIRKKLFYMAFGVIPYYYTVSTDVMAHDDIYELFHSVPDILFNDHTWQGEDSVNGNRTRRERNPHLEETE